MRREHSYATVGQPCIETAKIWRENYRTWRKDRRQQLDPCIPGARCNQRGSHPWSVHVTTQSL